MSWSHSLFSPLERVGGSIISSLVFVLWLSVVAVTVGEKDRRVTEGQIGLGTIDVRSPKEEWDKQTGRRR